MTAVYFPLNENTWRITEKWINNNIEKGNCNFQELNVGFVQHHQLKFNPEYHNCVKITFKNEIDKNYFILVWGDKLR